MNTSILLVGIIAMSLCAFAAGEPTTMPTTLPTKHPIDTWMTSEIGRTVLHPFATAPYPHASRADGYKTSDGVVPKIGHYDDSTVGIFVPTNYTPGEVVDYVVHFHGHRNHVENVLSQFKLAEQLAQSHVNAILLVPQGPKDVPDSGGGKLELDDDGFKRFIDEATTYLNAEHVIQTSRVGSIALSAHSGGYKTLASVLHRGGLTDHVTDVLLFDATYGNLQWFADYAIARPDGRLISFHTKHLDDENASLTKMLDEAKTPSRDVAEAALNAQAVTPRGVTFISTTLKHDDVPSYLRLMLETSRLEKTK